MRSDHTQLASIATPGRSNVRPHSVLARDANGQPRTYRLARSTAQQAAYRRLVVAILGLDVQHLAAQLRSARSGLARAA
jgi:hypothetical protein